MASEGQAAIARLEAIAPHHPALEELRASSRKIQATAAHKVIPEVAHQPAIPLEVRETSKSKPEPEVPLKESKVSEPAPKSTRKPPVPERPPTIAADAEDLLGELLTDDLGESGSEHLIPATAAGKPASNPVPSIRSSAPAPAVSAQVPASARSPEPISANPLAGMVADLEDALRELPPPPQSRAAKPSPTPKQVAAPASQIRHSAAVQGAPASVPGSGDPQQAASMLSDLLDEFKEGIEEPAADGDDPDTHYNLGVAFREMGLLDEAIGELQKVCRALDNGSSFSQPIQAYTWLAQCLVDKGAPQAAIRWYERALHVGGISEDSRLAVYYDMANAFESAGNKKAALDNFMEVYGANIDYRDVADRIRSLRT